MNKIFNHIGMQLDNKVMNDHILAQDILDKHRIELCKYVIELYLITKRRKYPKRMFLLDKNTQNLYYLNINNYYNV